MNRTHDKPLPAAYLALVKSTGIERRRRNGFRLEKEALKRLPALNYRI